MVVIRFLFLAKVMLLLKGLSVYRIRNRNRKRRRTLPVESVQRRPILCLIEFSAFMEPSGIGCTI